jgi:hypothetical protein
VEDKEMKHKNILKNGLFAFLMTIAVIVKADPARVISKEEGIPHTNNTTRTRIFLDKTPNDENNRADAYVVIAQTVSCLCENLAI